MNLTEVISKQRIVPIIRPNRVDQTVEDIGIYGEADYYVIEILCRTPQAIESIRSARKAFPNLYIGAGTVLTPEFAEEAVGAGAQFIVSPAMDLVVGNVAKRHGVPFIPGICTPTDVAIALREGFTLQKFFPAEQSGGVAMLDAFASPYGHTPLQLIAGGGVGKANVAAYWNHPLIAAIIADWLVCLEGDSLRQALSETRAMLAD